MKVPRTANAVGCLDDDLVAAAAEYSGETAADSGRKEQKSGRSRDRGRKSWHKWVTAAAACLAVAVAVGAAVLPFRHGGTEVLGSQDRYGDSSIQLVESTRIWPWEYQTVYEKYTSADIDGVPYVGKGRPVSEELLGEHIGTYPVSGWEESNSDAQHTEAFEVYALENVDREQFVAVQMEGSYYVFQRDVYDPPATLGELLEAVDLPQVIELSRFEERGSGGAAGGPRALTDDAPIWEILEDCGSAAFVEDHMWSASQRNCLSFTVTSEALGVYKVALYVTEDGYLWTNAFGWQYLFQIGQEAAGQIIQYAKGNSAEAQEEPYLNTVAGAITEITEDYIVLDDAVLCRDPADGIQYKVLLEDVRISRYVDLGVLQEGDLVQVTYDGTVPETEAYTISSAVSIDKAVLLDGGGAAIPE